MDIRDVPINNANAKQIAAAIRHQDEVAKSTLEKIEHQLREMNMHILENANFIIAKEVPFGFSSADYGRNVELALDRKKELLRLSNLISGVEGI